MTRRTLCRLEPSFCGFCSFFGSSSEVHKFFSADVLLLFILAENVEGVANAITGVNVASMGSEENTETSRTAMANNMQAFNNCLVEPLWDAYFSGCIEACVLGFGVLFGHLGSG